MTLRHVFFVVFLLWGLPLANYRSRFRKLVYQTDHWSINIKPVFWKELKGLFGTLYPDNPDYIRFRGFYRVYVLVHMILFSLWYFS